MNITADGPERMMWGVFATSKLDDVIHGRTDRALNHKALV
jgi:hypothetical protein